LFRHFSLWEGVEEMTMIDTGVIVTTVTRSSTFDCLPANFGDPDRTDLDRLAASLDYLAACCCKPGPDNASPHRAGEAIEATPVG